MTRALNLHWADDTDLYARTRDSTGACIMNTRIKWSLRFVETYDLTCKSRVVDPANCQSKNVKNPWLSKTAGSALIDLWATITWFPSSPGVAIIDS